MSTEVLGSLPEWKRAPFGYLERVTTYPSGMTRTERVDPRVGKIKISDNYPDAERVYYRFKKIEYDPEIDKYFSEVFGPESWQETGRLVKDALDLLATEGNHIKLLNAKEQITEAVYFPGSDIIVIYFFEGNKLGESLSTATGKQEVMLASLGYNRNGLSSCVLQAESPSSIGKAEDLSWKESLPLLVNYIRTASDPLEKHREIYELFYRAYLREKNLDESNPRVQEANNLATELIKKAINSLPSDDREESQRLLLVIGWQQDLARELLEQFELEKNISLEQALESFGRENFLKERISATISHFKDSPEIYQELLKLNKFSTTEFEWQELRVETEVSKKQEGTASYGSEIKIQENTFKIDKSNDSIIVTCFSNRDKPRWTVKFPFKVPPKKIKDMYHIYNDPREDFRKIRQLVRMSFRRQLS